MINDVRLVWVVRLYDLCLSSVVNSVVLLSYFVVLIGSGSVMLVPSLGISVVSLFSVYLLFCCCMTAIVWNSVVIDMVFCLIIVVCCRLVFVDFCVVNSCVMVLVSGVICGELLLFVSIFCVYYGILFDSMMNDLGLVFASSVDLFVCCLILLCCAAVCCSVVFWFNDHSWWFSGLLFIVLVVVEISLFPVFVCLGSLGGISLLVVCLHFFHVLVGLFLLGLVFRFEQLIVAMSIMVYTDSLVVCLLVYVCYIVLCSILVCTLCCLFCVCMCLFCLCGLLVGYWFI